MPPADARGGQHAALVDFDADRLVKIPENKLVSVTLKGTYLFFSGVNKLWNSGFTRNTSDALL